MVKELMEARNVIDAKIASITAGYSSANTQLLVQEIMNLLDGVGDFRGADDYAPARIYSQIDGVKNLSLGVATNFLWVKVTSRRGYLIPSTVVVRGCLHVTKFIHSRVYDGEVNY